MHPDASRTRVPPRMPGEAAILIARIGAPHGVGGDVRVTVFAEDPRALTAYGPLTTADGRRFRVRSTRPGKGVTIVSFDGVSDRDAAARLSGTALFADRSALPPTAADEFYHADLIGLSAVGADGSALGTVTVVHNYGAGDILEIAPPEGETILLPFDRSIFPEIDLQRGRILVVPPEETKAAKARNSPDHA